MSLYAVKNDRGEWYDWSDMEFWPKDACTFVAIGNQDDAEHVADSTAGGHVVDLIEAPAKVVVSEEEAEMLEQAKCDDDPAELIVGFVNSHDKYDDDSKAEDRLMRAYVLGWTVEKPKLWNVKVPHTKFYYWKWKPNEPGVGSGEDDDVRGVEPYRFTIAEIEHYGLHDCEKEEVTDDEQ